jgi:anti-sigma B factor antagonist
MQQSALRTNFCCDVRPEPERVVVRLAGELDLAAAPVAAASVDELLDAGRGPIVVDLRPLRFLDSAGVHTLLSAQRAAQRRRCALSLLRGPAHVHRVFEATGTEPLLAFDAPEGPA